ncbi:MAG: oligosaccharide flippase family protein, partial [Parcubacteria group bacterium]|nr:oligosaccharide flippase family protein [Parcubacteria group bacterium]
MNLANRTIKNALYGLVSYVWPIVFSLAITPIIIHKLGVEQYGVYALTLVIGSFFSLLNFGLVYSFIQELAKIRTGATAGEIEHIQKLYGATVLVFLILGIFSFLVSLGIAHFGLNFFNLSQDQHAVGKIVFYLMGITAFLNSIGIVYSHIPYALQRQDIGTGIYIINVIITNMLIIGALFFGYGLLTFVGLQTVSALFSVVAAYWYSRKLLPFLVPEYTLKKEIIKPMFQFGGYIYLHNISASFLSQIDRIIISGSIGPTALTLYSLPNSVAEKTQGIVVSLSGILFPVMSELTKDGDISRIRRAYHQAMRMIALLATGITTTILLLADKTLLFWVGKD